DLGPSSGSTLGGDPVALVGSGFTGATAVSFGGISLSPSSTIQGFNLFSDNAIMAYAPARAVGTAFNAPPRAAGTIDVTVTVPSGTLVTSSANRFTYNLLPPPVVTGLGPPSGLVVGGDPVTPAGSPLT